MFASETTRTRNDFTPKAARQTVLIVEDDPSISGLVQQILEEEGFSVRAAGTGADAEAGVDQFRPDLVILDIMLPDTDGLMLCSRLLAKTSAPIIMLSGSRRESDRILSLRLGADDFIAKPFDALELVARVEAVLRRAPRELGGLGSMTPGMALGVAGALNPREMAQPAARGSREVLRVGELTIDARRRTVSVGNQPVHLTPTENRLLTALASEPERVFSRDELATVLWGYDSLGESRAVDVHIRRLRAKLEPFEEHAPPIVTVRGFGYKLGLEDADG